MVPRKLLQHRNIQSNSTAIGKIFSRIIDNPRIDINRVISVNFQFHLLTSYQHDYTFFLLKYS